MIIHVLTSHNSTILILVLYVTNTEWNLESTDQTKTHSLV